MTQYSIRYPYKYRDRFLAEPLDDLELAVSRREREVLRPLAARVAELAARPIEDEKRDLWYRHNALEATRPLIFCDLENGWSEIIPPGALQCEGELARYWELILRKEIFWGTELLDDTVIKPYFDLPYVHNDVEWGLAPRMIGGEEGGAYTWESPIKTEDDVEKLRTPEMRVDRDATGRLVALAEKTFDGLLPVRLNTRWVPLFPMTRDLARLRGLQQIMYDMVDNPAMIHRIMAFLTNGYEAILDYLEENDLLGLNNDGSYVGTGGFGWSKQLPQADFQGKVRTRDIWGSAESQETVGISPEMFDEFVLPYQLPILSRFGLNCYGCCEPLDTRWHVVEKIPGLRRVSVAPLSDVAGMAEKLGDRYIFSMKPNPTDLAMSTFDEGRIRSDLRKAFHVTRDCRMEVIMKDNHTINNDPGRVVRWVEIARAEAERL